MQDQIIGEFLFLTGSKVLDIKIVCYVTFDYVTTDAIDCLHFDTLYISLSTLEYARSDSNQFETP